MEDIFDSLASVTKLTPSDISYAVIKPIKDNFDFVGKGNFIILRPKLYTYVSGLRKYIVS